jgi:hypothetical protein
MPGCSAMSARITLLAQMLRACGLQQPGVGVTSHGSSNPLATVRSLLTAMLAARRLCQRSGPGGSASIGDQGRHRRVG